MALLDQFDGTVPDQIVTDTEPLRCIHCGEDDNVHYTALQSDAYGCWRNAECLTCGTVWQEVYKFALIDYIEIGDKL